MRTPSIEKKALFLSYIHDFRGIAILLIVSSHILMEDMDNTFYRIMSAIFLSHSSKDDAVSLLGMSKEADWVLHAPYSDKSLMRDVLAYQLGRSLGHYAPHTRFCELVVDGDYQGVYVLVEKVKRDKDRVDIAKLKEEDISGEEVTGGYIIQVDKQKEGSENEGWTSPYPPLQRANDQAIFFQYNYPKSDDIVPEQQAYIQQYVASFEDALASDNFADPEVGYAQYIDVASFVDYFIASEVARNADAYRVGAFLHKQKSTKGGKLVMGPLWDFNLGFGNIDYCLGGGTEGLAMDFNSACPEDEWLVPFWWDRLFQDSAFVEQVGVRWAQLRSNQFATERVLAQVDSAATLLNEAQERNFTQWPILGVDIQPNAFVGQTYQEEVDQLKNWISARMVWLDSTLIVASPPPAEEPPVVTGIEDDEPTGAGLVAYPVPFRDELTVEFTPAHAGIATLQIRDLLGKTVLRTSSYHATSSQQSLSWNTSSLPPGLYVVQLQVGDASLVTRKIYKR